MPAKAAFRERRENSLPDDVHLTPSQHHGVLSQEDYTKLTGNRVVQNLAGQNSMKHVEPDDFIIHLRSFQGGIEHSLLRGKVSTAYTVLMPLAGYVPNYFKWLLKSDAYIQVLRTTTNQLRDGQSIKFADFSKVPLPVPPMAQQTIIGDYLDRETAQIDTLISEQQRLIDLLDERRVSLLESVTAHLLGHATKDKLSRFTKIGNGSTPRRDTVEFWAADGTPWLNSSVANKASVHQADQFVTDTALAQCHLPLVPPGAVLVGLTGQGRTRGMATLLEIEATINQHLAYVIPDRRVWDSRFLLWILRSNYMRLRQVSEENGSTKGGLTCQQLKDLRVPRPSVARQREIAADLDRQTAKIQGMSETARSLISLARERRSALITAAVTGRLEIPEVA